MKYFIFITKEGHTYQPNSQSTEPDIDNCQVLGFVHGENEAKAVDNFLKENEHLIDTSFNEVMAFEMKNTGLGNQPKFSLLLNDLREKV